MGVLIPVLIALPYISVIFGGQEGGYNTFREIRPEMVENPVFCQDSIFVKKNSSFFRKIRTVFPLLLAGFDTSTSCKSGVAGDDFVTGQDLLPVRWYKPTRTRNIDSGGNAVDVIHFSSSLIDWNHLLRERGVSETGGEGISLVILSFHLVFWFQDITSFGWDYLLWYEVMNSLNQLKILSSVSPYASTPFLASCLR